MLPLASLLPGLLLSGVQAAGSRRQRQRIAAVAVLGAIACVTLLAAAMLFGWALFLAYGADLSPPWAAVAAGGTLLGAVTGLGALAALVWTYWPQHSIHDDLAKIRAELEPLARQHPLAAIGIAAGLGALLSSLLKK